MFNIKKQNVIVSSGLVFVFLVGVFIILSYRQTSRRIERQIEQSVINEIQRMRMKEAEFAANRSDSVIMHLESTALNSISLKELVQKNHISTWEHSIDNGQISSIHRDKQLEIINRHDVLVFVFTMEEIGENMGSIKMMNFWPRDDYWGLEISNWIIRKQNDVVWQVVEKKTTYIE